MKEPGPDHPISIAKNPKRIRVVLGGVIVAETTQALTLKEASLPPVHYIPRRDVQMDLLERSTHVSRCPYKGEASYFNVMAGGLVRENAAWSYEHPFPAVADLKGRIAFHARKVDAIEELRE